MKISNENPEEGERPRIPLVSAHLYPLGSFAFPFNVTFFVNGTFGLFNAMCKQHHRIALNPFLNGTKNVYCDGTCKRAFNLHKIATLFLVSEDKFRNSAWLSTQPLRTW